MVHSVQLPPTPDSEAQSLGLASVPLEQQKLGQPATDFVAVFCESYPHYFKDVTVSRAHSLVDLERDGPRLKGRERQAHDFYLHIIDLIQSLPATGAFASVRVRFRVVTSDKDLTSLPQPKEAAVVATINDEGISRRIIKPTSVAEDPADEAPLEEARLPLGIIVIVQTYNPLVSPIKDNRLMGMGAGADIFQERAVEKDLGGGEAPADENVTLPPGQTSPMNHTYVPVEPGEQTPNLGDESASAASVAGTELAEKREFQAEHAGHALRHVAEAAAIGAVVHQTQARHREEEERTERAAETQKHIEEHPAGETFADQENTQGDQNALPEGEAESAQTDVDLLADNAGSPEGALELGTLETSGLEAAELEAEEAPVRPESAGGADAATEGEAAGEVEAESTSGEPLEGDIPGGVGTELEAAGAPGAEGNAFPESAESPTELAQNQTEEAALPLGGETADTPEAEAAAQGEEGLAPDAEVGAGEVGVAENDAGAAEPNEAAVAEGAAERFEAAEGSAGAEAEVPEPAGQDSENAEPRSAESLSGASGEPESLNDDAERASALEDEGSEQRGMPDPEEIKRQGDEFEEDTEGVQTRAEGGEPEETKSAVSEARESNETAEDLGQEVSAERQGGQENPEVAEPAAQGSRSAEPQRADELTGASGESSSAREAFGEQAEAIVTERPEQNQGEQVQEVAEHLQHLDEQLRPEGGREGQNVSEADQSGTDAGEGSGAEQGHREATAETDAAATAGSVSGAAEHAGPGAEGVRAEGSQGGAEFGESPRQASFERDGAGQGTESNSDSQTGPAEIHDVHEVLDRTQMDEGQSPDHVPGSERDRMLSEDATAEAHDHVSSGERTERSTDDQGLGSRSAEAGDATSERFDQQREMRDDARERTFDGSHESNSSPHDYFDQTHAEGHSITEHGGGPAPEPRSHAQMDFSAEEDAAKRLLDQQNSGSSDLVQHAVLETVGQALPLAAAGISHAAAGASLAKSTLLGTAVKIAGIRTSVSGVPSAKGAAAAPSEQKPAYARRAVKRTAPQQPSAAAPMQAKPTSKPRATAPAVKKNIKRVVEKKSAKAAPKPASPTDLPTPAP